MPEEPTPELDELTTFMAAAAVAADLHDARVDAEGDDQRGVMDPEEVAASVEIVLLDHGEKPGLRERMLRALTGAMTPP